MGLLYLFIVFLGLMIAFLAMPIDVKLSYDTSSEQKTRLRIGCLFGLLNFDLPMSQARHARKKSTSSKPKSKNKAPKSALTMLQSHGFLYRCSRLLRDLFEVIKVKKFRCRVRFGCADPADTGQLYGMLAANFAWAFNHSHLNLQVIPEFDHAVLEGSLHTNLRIVPLKIFLAVLSFALSPITFRAMWAVRGLN